MTYEEFTNRLDHFMSGPHKINNEDWEIIQLVYTYHPAISNIEGKDEIAELYCSMGMPFIRAMAPQAMTCKLLEEALQRAKNEFSDREQRLQEAIRRAEKRRDEDIANITELCASEIAELKAGFKEGVTELVIRIQDLTDRLGNLEGGR